ncbi:MAG: cupin domain-containing protein [Cyanobacteriota bacterium]|nr:cupin domain-containing protein [Cyanobacteriota bacterium]
MGTRSLHQKQDTSESTSVLAELIYPYSREAFLQEVWTQKSVYLTGGGTRRFDDLLSWATLSELLNHHDFEYPTLRLAKNGQVLAPVENANFLKHCQEGATLILDRVHKFVPEIARFATAFRSEIGHPVQVNLYGSWPGIQGFKCHYDTHEVFILQVDGSKTWSIFADTVKYPLDDQKSALQPPPEGAPESVWTLEAGDILYIPRGHWHYAVATDGPSLHLTVGVTSQTGLSFVEWVSEQLRDRVRWRENLPLLSEAEPVSLRHRLHELIAELNDYLNDESVVSAYESYLAQAGKPAVRYAFPYQVGFGIFAEGRKTQFYRPPYQRVQISELEGDRGYQILASGKEITLAGVPKSFVETLFSTDNFSGLDVSEWLPDYDWEIDLVPLLSRLVTEGVIFVAKDC